MIDDHFAHILWEGVPDPKHSLMDTMRALYAYIAPDRREVLYVGKAYGCTVGQRWCRSGKPEFWNWMETERGFAKHAIIIGNLVETSYQRVTEQLITDIESLLIYRLKPSGNVQSRKSRGYSRPGLRVQCSGDWPHRRARFFDRG